MASSSTLQAPRGNEAPSSSAPDGSVDKQEKTPERSDAGRRRNVISRILSAIVGSRKPSQAQQQQQQQQQQFGDLRDVVSYSSRRMAAGRALEHELSKCKESGVAPLFLDPLASFLAGPAAIEDARRWEEASAVAADAVADALACGKNRPSKEELVEVIKKKQEESDKKNKRSGGGGGSAFTIGAPLSLVALAGRSIHRGRVDASTPGAFAPGKKRSSGKDKSKSKGEEVVASSKNAVSLVTARHRWFDESMLDALRGEGYGVGVKLSVVEAACDDAGAGAPVKVEVKPRRGASPPSSVEIRQVVMLGSGMDARAWRLPLLPSSSSASGEKSEVAWFDLDSEPVIEIKLRELEDAGAELTTPESTTTDDDDKNDKNKGKHKSKNKSKKKIRFPLKCSSYAAVGCDMKKSPEWAQKLLASAEAKARFDPSKPALFCAEGLLYYLGEGAPEFLRCLSGIAAPGSVLLLDALDEAGIANAVKKAEGKGLQGQFKFGVPESLEELESFFANYGFGRLVAADTLDVLRERFRREAPRRTFSRGEKVAFGAAEGGIRFIAVAKGV